MNDSRTVLLVAAALTLFGCAQRMTYGIGAPVLDSHFGEAVTRARALQVIRPEGLSVNDEGYSGRAAQAAMERYDTPAKQAAPTPVLPMSGSAEKTTK